jgi:hypothetical protein
MSSTSNLTHTNPPRLHPRSRQPRASQAPLLDNSPFMRAFEHFVIYIINGHPRSPTPHPRSRQPRASQAPLLDNSPFMRAFEASASQRGLPQGEGSQSSSSTSSSAVLGGATGSNSPVKIRPSMTEDPDTEDPDAIARAEREQRVQAAFSAPTAAESTAVTTEAVVVR